ncbi:hypothetical protein [Streptomyces sp.]|uniref:hypothetical protein n=1 Tax=Streptomyces sp. TaxID=1931 RepID=UPI0028123A87|nr:hypothetical protein [Streptomyces sp.]
MTAKHPALDAVGRLYEDHMRAPYPRGLRGADRAGIDMVTLDADTAGWVHTCIKNGGSLDARGHGILLRCADRLDRVMPALAAADDPAYWRRLRDLARLVADTVPSGG